MKSANFAGQCVVDQSSIEPSLVSVCSGTQVSCKGINAHIFQISEGLNTALDVDRQGTIELASRSLNGGNQLISAATAHQPYTRWQNNRRLRRPIRSELARVGVPQRQAYLRLNNVASTTGINYPWAVVGSGDEISGGAGNDDLPPRWEQPISTQQGMSAFTDPIEAHRFQNLPVVLSTDFKVFS